VVRRHGAERDIWAGRCRSRYLLAKNFTPSACGDKTAYQCWAATNIFDAEEHRSPTIRRGATLPPNIHISTLVERYRLPLHRLAALSTSAHYCYCAQTANKPSPPSLPTCLTAHNRHRSPALPLRCRRMTLAARAPCATYRPHYHTYLHSAPAFPPPALPPSVAYIARRLRRTPPLSRRSPSPPLAQPTAYRPTSPICARARAAWAEIISRTWTGRWKVNA